MTKSETMNCAAILAAGIISKAGTHTAYDADNAVDLMLQIAERITRETAEPEREYRHL